MAGKRKKDVFDSLRELPLNASITKGNFGKQPIQGYLTFLTVYILVLAYHAIFVPLAKLTPRQIHEELVCGYAKIFWAVICTLTLRDLQVEVFGDDISGDESALIISNHLSRLDYAIISQIAETSGLNGKVNFFVWKRCTKFPDVKTMYNTLRTTQNWSLTNAELTKQFRPLEKSAMPYWTVVFPEVDIMSPTVLAKNISTCKKAGGPVYQNVLAPRFSAFVQALNHLNRTGGVSWVYDLTITYWHDETKLGGNSRTFVAPTIDDLIFANDGKWRAEVHVKKIPSKNVPKKPHVQEKWLEKTWVHKDTFIKKRVKKSTNDADEEKYLKKQREDTTRKSVGTL